MTKRFAFTLAEVLIALAIIGVVAAMTIPTFMANTAGAQFRTGFKKGVTVLTQAAAANYATEGFDFSGTTIAYGGTVAAPASTTTSTGVVIDDDNDARVGFNTSEPEDIGANLDLQQDVASLFHIFQGNLNMKNSNEVANYDVGLPDVSLNCTPTAEITIKNPNAAGNLTASGVTELTSRATANDLDEGNQTVGGIANLCEGRTVAQGGINQGRMFALEDGMIFTYDAGQMSCSENNPCYGYLDVNGAAGPNRVISCSEGENAFIRSYGSRVTGNDANMLAASCTVAAKDVSDIYPVVFYGSTVKPATLAAKAVLYSQKSNQVEE